MKFVHFLILTGGEDTYLHLITQEALDWINSDLPAFPQGVYSVEDTGVPEAVQHRRDHDGELAPFKISSGSPYNDRMLACPMNMFKDIVVADHFSVDVKNMIELGKQIEEIGYEIGDTLEGYMY